MRCQRRRDASQTTTHVEVRFLWSPPREKVINSSAVSRVLWWGAGEPAQGRHLLADSRQKWWAVGREGLLAEAHEIWAQFLEGLVKEKKSQLFWWVFDGANFSQPLESLSVATFVGLACRWGLTPSNDTSWPPKNRRTPTGTTFTLLHLMNWDFRIDWCFLSSDDATGSDRHSLQLRWLTLLKSRISKQESAALEPWSCASPLDDDWRWFCLSV